VVLVVRNARHSTEAKGTRLTPKEPDRPAAIMPLNACPSSAATGAPRAVKRSRPVGYVALPDAQRAVCDRQHALLRNDHVRRTREPVPHWARSPEPRCPRRSTDLTAADNGLAGFLARTAIMRRRPRSSAIAVGFALQKEIVHRRPWRATNPASARCGLACSERAIAQPGAARGVTRRRVMSWAQARSDGQGLIGRLTHDRYDG
jgi:hypothetical protein